MSIPAYHRLATSLRERILAGEFRPGDRLPVEPELSAGYGVSRSTVREALRLLASQNLIATLRGVSGGSFVVAPRPEQIGDYLHTSFNLLAADTRITVDQLLEIRALLEVPAAGLAALRRSQDDLDELRAALFDPATLPLEEMHEPNKRFHTLLLRSSGNPVLEVVAQPVFQVLDERFLRERAPDRFWHEVDRDHREILARVEAGDEKGASEAAGAHLEHLRSTYQAIDRAS
ncbi:FadR/GntR family transcriptional regulator [Nonomuraea soli]|uniref:DNA-binding FadR family transcriptional regulator n=1 Tax=Nonomuraea soli TaxID=1032476 RepID=A0A7W0CGI8_9ACTN|nr:FCD domain-containing protein [Nonomuraea soli]MBA2890760.1 DNA-binding FadR family transcriptional regulator [Nonomuraea soli]